MAEQARLLIKRVEYEQTARLAKDEIIDIITTIAVYKFSQLSREEVEAMLGLSLEKTRIYQEAKAEGRLEQKTEMLKVTVPLLLKMGMSMEQIAQQLNVDLEAVRSAAQ
ncbi:MAG: DUF2887 domain-containing protein [Scytonema sp. PMC 1069.18]|nr:DUF2887 domain-containing protein [Scytonema sp. PMC 1069.18]MEC4884126.1 DUF2887 domain-containing protein [Scytonema sp. PMC 1070.18]